MSYVDRKQQPLVIVHKHFHYYHEIPNQLGQSQLSQSERRVKRARSYQELNVPFHYKSRRQLEGSRWEEIMNPQIQTIYHQNIQPKQRQDHPRPYLPHQKIDNQQQKTQVSKRQAKTSAIIQKAEKILSEPSSIVKTVSFQTQKEENNKSFDEDSYLKEQQNSSLKSSPFSKTKSSEELDLRMQMKQGLERMGKCDEKGYKYRLLEEECTYLRRKFLEHYERKHEDMFGKKAGK